MILSKYYDHPATIYTSHELCYTFAEALRRMMNTDRDFSMVFETDGTQIGEQILKHTFDWFFLEHMRTRN